MKRSHTTAFDENVNTALLAVTQHLPHIPAAVPVAARFRTLSHWFRANVPRWPAISGGLSWTRPQLPFVFGPCAACEHLPIVRWLSAIQGTVYPNFAFHYFANRGITDVVDLLWQSFPDKECWPTVCETAVCAGKWDTVQLLVVRGVRITNDVVIGAVIQDRLDMLQWMLQDCGKNYFPSITEAAAGLRNIRILNWLTTNGFPRRPSAFFGAVRNGLFDVVDWLLLHGYPLNSHVYRYAIISVGDDSDVVRYLEQLHNRGFPLDNVNCLVAVHERSLVALKWFHDQGCPWDEDTTTEAARWGHIEILDWAVSNGCPWNMFNVIEEAYGNGNLRLFLWALDHGWIITESDFEKAATCEHPHVARFLQRNKPQCQ